jgi:hypothetical protein
LTSVNVFMLHHLYHISSKSVETKILLNLIKHCQKQKPKKYLFFVYMILFSYILGWVMALA